MGCGAAALNSQYIDFIAINSAYKFLLRVVVNQEFVFVMPFFYQVF
jgi:hypothetical protein